MFIARLDTVNLTGARVPGVDDEADALKLLAVMPRRCGATLRAEPFDASWHPGMW